MAAPAIFATGFRLRRTAGLSDHATRGICVRSGIRRATVRPLRVIRISCPASTHARRAV